MKKLFLLSILATSLGASAQYVANYKKVADVYFQNGDYYAASEYYKKGLGITSDTVKMVYPYNGISGKKADKGQSSYEDMVYRLAESNRMFKNFVVAEKYYGIAKDFKDKAYADSWYFYGLSLKANAKYQMAVDAFKAYRTANPNGHLANEADAQIKACQWIIEEMKFPKLVQINKIANPAVNGEGSNYGAVLVGDQFYFTSSRPNEPAGKTVQVGKTTAGPVFKTPTNYLNNLYAVPANFNGEADNVKKLDFPKEKGREYAAPSFAADAQKLYFTSWINNDTTVKKQIYVSSLVQGKWSKPVAMPDPVNSIGANSIQPCITPDGKYIIFSSDRAGGQGKYDLWFCNLRADGTLGQAINFGSGINSPGDEKSAYYDQSDMKLIFSSDGRGGFGGADLFYAEGAVSNLASANNMGYPMNSGRDDVYFSGGKDSDNAFFSSDRASECCLELFAVNKMFISIKGKLIDCKTKKPLVGATVKMFERDQVRTATTNADGLYSFKVNDRRPLKMSFEKPDYFAQTKAYTTEQIAQADTLLYEEGCLTPFKVNESIVLENIYFAFNSAELNQDSKNTLNTLVKILKDNEKLSIELSAHTDSKGTDEYNQKLSQRRAESCVRYLIESGVAETRLTAKGYGESKPVAPNTLANGKDNPEGRAKNRRTEFTVLGQDL